MIRTRPFLLLLAAGLVFSLAACNTVEGFGKDVKKAGQKIEEKAK